MNRFVTVNLDKYYNHKIIYRQEPKEKIGKEIGLDNVFILRSDIMILNINRWITHLIRLKNPAKTWISKKK